MGRHYITAKMGHHYVLATGLRLLSTQKHGKAPVTRHPSRSHPPTGYCSHLLPATAAPPTPPHTVPTFPAGEIRRTARELREFDELVARREERRTLDQLRDRR